MSTGHSTVFTTGAQPTAAAARTMLGYILILRTLLLRVQYQRASILVLRSYMPPVSPSLNMQLAGQANDSLADRQTDRLG